MKILLINPPLIVQSNLWDGNAPLYPPLGLAYIASALKGNEVKILDSQIEGYKNSWKIDENVTAIGINFEEIAKRAKEFNPDIIGITGLSFWKKSVYKTSKALKKVLPKTKIIIGGPYATNSFYELLKDKIADIIVISEGEETIKDIIDSLKNKKKISNVKGIAFNHKGKIKVTSRREPIVELDKINFPERNLLKMDEYFRAFRMLNSSQGLGRWISVVTSRGCPFNCVFCSASKITGKRWRYRSPENIVAEIEQAVKNYKINEIFFEDENISLNKGRMEKICDLLIKKRFNLRLYAEQGMRADTLDEKVLIKMRHAGFRVITIAPESGVQRVVDEVIDKSLQLKKIEEVIRLCKKTGIAVSCFLVIGMPGETKKEIIETVNYARKLRKLGAYYCTVNNAVPICGTRMYELAKKNMQLILDKNEMEKSVIFNRHKHLFKTKEWNPGFVEAMYQKAIKENSRDSMFSAYLWKYRIRRLAYGLIYSPKAILKRFKERIAEFICGRKKN